MLIGKYQMNLEPTGRIIFPAKFREDMGKGFVLAKGFFDPCLCAYPEDEWKRLCENLKSFPEAKVRQVKNWLFGSASPVAPDKQGRVFITPELIEHAGLCREITFVGMGSRVDIWDAQRYEQMYNAITPESIADVLTQLDF